MFFNQSLRWAFLTGFGLGFLGKKKLRLLRAAVYHSRALNPKGQVYLATLWNLRCGEVLEMALIVASTKILVNVAQSSKCMSKVHISRINIGEQMYYSRLLSSLLLCFLLLLLLFITYIFLLYISVYYYYKYTIIIILEVAVVSLLLVKPSYKIY